MRKSKSKPLLNEFARKFFLMQIYIYVSINVHQIWRFSKETPKPMLVSSEMTFNPTSGDGWMAHRLTSLRVGLTMSRLRAATVSPSARRENGKPKTVQLMRNLIANWKQVSNCIQTLNHISRCFTFPDAKHLYKPSCR